MAGLWSTLKQHLDIRYPSQKSSNKTLDVHAVAHFTFRSPGSLVGRELMKKMILFKDIRGQEETLDFEK